VNQSDVAQPSDEGLGLGNEEAKESLEEDSESQSPTRPTSPTCPICPEEDSDARELQRVTDLAKARKWWRMDKTTQATIKEA
jgi:hypothetical protein